MALAMASKNLGGESGVRGEREKEGENGENVLCANDGNTKDEPTASTSWKRTWEQDREKGAKERAGGSDGVFMRGEKRRFNEGRIRVHLVNQKCVRWGIVLERGVPCHAHLVERQTRQRKRHAETFSQHVATLYRQ